jgi:hypothetical protein
MRIFVFKKYVKRLLELKNIPVLVVDTDKEIIVEWIRYPNTKM